MKVNWTSEALDDLAGIANYLALHYPSTAPAVESRLRAVVARIARWPESAQPSAGRTGVRVAVVGRYPYKIFYRLTRDAVEILHVHHVARQPWDDQP